jgi:hypothetical protein
MVLEYIINYKKLEGNFFLSLALGAIYALDLEFLSNGKSLYLQFTNP